MSQKAVYTHQEAGIREQHGSQMKNRFGELQEYKIPILQNLGNLFQGVVDGFSPFNVITLSITRELRNLRLDFADHCDRRFRQLLEENRILSLQHRKVTTAEQKFARSAIAAINFTMKNSIGSGLVVALLSHDLTDIFIHGGVDEALATGFAPKCFGYLKSETEYKTSTIRTDEDRLQPQEPVAEPNPAELSLTNLPDLDLPALTATEGRLRLRAHLYRERRQEIVRAKKQEVLDTTGRLTCEICDFDFEAVYGLLGNGFCEVHHKAPLNTVKTEVTTELKDLAILCSNCHRMVHRTNPLKSIDELRRLVKSRKPEKHGN